MKRVSAACWPAGAGRLPQVVEGAQPARRDGARAAHHRGARAVAALLAAPLPQPHLHALPGTTRTASSNRLAKCGKPTI